MESAVDALVLLTCLFTGLVAGSFYVFSAMVMPALRKLPAVEGVRAMQSINLAAVRPPFMVGFMGSTALCLGLGIWAATRLGTSGAALELIACGTYLVGCFGVTAAFHVPRNNALAAMEVGSVGTVQYWTRYQREWSAMNHLRAAAAAAASGLLALSLTY